MNYNLILDKQVKSDLHFELQESLEVSIEKSGDLHFEIKDFSQDINLVFAKGIQVNITCLFNSENDLNINYQINENCDINELMVSEIDDLKIKINKHVIVEKEASYEVSSGFFNDSDIMLNVNIDLNGQNASAIHNVAVISRNKNEKIFNVTINNNVLNTIGNLSNFGVVKDSGKLLFNGTGNIVKGASQSQAHQESKIITFDPGVEAQANPFLIIDESDVEASHAASVGKMDENQLYYLQSRGINKENASRLITYGYLKPILKKITDENLRSKLEDLIEMKVGV